MDQTGFHNVTPCNLDLLRQELDSYKQRLIRTQLVAANGRRRGARPLAVKPISS